LGASKDPQSLNKIPTRIHKDPQTLHKNPQGLPFDPQSLSIISQGSRTSMELQGYLRFLLDLVLDTQRTHNVSVDLFLGSSRDS